MLRRMMMASGAGSYPSNVIACYGIKRLNPSYSGNLIRVRRSSDNAELDIGQAAGVLDTSALSSFVGADSAHIVKAYDQQGSNDLVQATSANQPRIVNAGTYLGHGEFDGSGDLMLSASALTFSGKAMTVFAKIQRAAASGSVVEPMLGIGPNGYTAYAGGVSFYYDPRSGSLLPNYTLAISNGGTPGVSTVNAHNFSGSLASMNTLTCLMDSSQAAGSKSKVWIAGTSITDVGASFGYNANITNDIVDEKFAVGGAAGLYARMNMIGLIVCDGDRSAERIAAEALF